MANNNAYQQFPYYANNEAFDFSQPQMQGAGHGGYYQFGGNYGSEPAPDLDFAPVDYAYADTAGATTSAITSPTAAHSQQQSPNDLSKFVYPQYPSQPGYPSMSMVPSQKIPAGVVAAYADMSLETGRNSM